MPIDSGRCDISLFDNKFQAVASETVWQENVLIITTKISLPNKLIMSIESCSDKTALELQGMVLSGIEVRTDVLLNFLEYKYCANHVMIESVAQLEALKAERVLCWDRDGYAIFNFFHPNPFAWHMYVGNKIKI